MRCRPVSGKLRLRAAVSNSQGNKLRRMRGKEGERERSPWAPVKDVC